MQSNGPQPTSDLHVLVGLHLFLLGVGREDGPPWVPRLNGAMLCK